MLLVAGLAFDLAVAWVIWRMVRQSRVYASIVPPEPGTAFEWPSVAVVVPARNEAQNIARCIAGLLRQDYPHDRIAVRLVDDGSTDRTVQVATRAACDDPRFRLQRGATLPEGWTGKSYACWQGARSTDHADYICFVDADTAAAPELFRAVVSHALTHRADMISLEPFQELGSPIERLVIPCGLYLIAASQDMARINSPAHPAAAANGQFLLFRSQTYDRIGGHAAVRADICEDTALASLAKRAGLRFELLGADRFIRTRMYRNWGSLWTGLSKNAATLGGGPIRTVLIAGAGLGLVMAGLALAVMNLETLLTRGSGLDAASAGVLLCGLGAIFGLHLAGARHFEIPLAYGLLFPLGYLLTFALALESARLSRLGRVRWKDRTYPAHRPSAGIGPAGLPMNGTHVDSGA